MSAISRVALLALLGVVAPSAGQGDTITTLFFDDFEAEPPEKLTAPLSKWDTLAGSVDVLGAANICLNAGDASNCVDLDGTKPPGGAIQTKALFALGPGFYRLSFDLAGSQRTFFTLTDTVTVSVGAYLLEDFTMGYTAPFETIVRNFMVPAADSVRLGFEVHGADTVGLLLDNVRFSNLVPDSDPDPDPDPDPNPLPVSEPATLYLLVSALAWLCWRFGKGHMR